MTTPKDIPTLSDSIQYVRANFNDLYPHNESRRKTLGNIPERLHAKLAAHAAEHRVKLFEVMAALVDFYEQHEAENAKTLTVQRKRNQRS
jgi:hypothetical protein